MGYNRQPRDPRERPQPGYDRPGNGEHHFGRYKGDPSGMGRYGREPPMEPFAQSSRSKDDQVLMEKYIRRRGEHPGMDRMRGGEPPMRGDPRLEMRDPRDKRGGYPPMGDPRMPSDHRMPPDHRGMPSDPQDPRDMHRDPRDPRSRDPRDDPRGHRGLPPGHGSRGRGDDRELMEAMMPNNPEQHSQRRLYEYYLSRKNYERSRYEPPGPDGRGMPAPHMMSQRMEEKRRRAEQKAEQKARFKSDFAR